MAAIEVTLDDAEVIAALNRPAAWGCETRGYAECGHRGEGRLTALQLHSQPGERSRPATDRGIAIPEGRGDAGRASARSCSGSAPPGILSYRDPAQLRTPPAPH